MLFMARMEIQADFDTMPTKSTVLRKLLQICYLEIKWILQDYAKNISIYPKYIHLNYHIYPYN